MQACPRPCPRGDYYSSRPARALGNAAKGSEMGPTRPSRAPRTSISATARSRSARMVSPYGQRSHRCRPQPARVDGDLLFVERVRDRRQLGGLARELDQLKTLAAQRAVPGHGPVAGWPAAIELNCATCARARRHRARDQAGHRHRRSLAQRAVDGADRCAVRGVSCAHSQRRIKSSNGNDSRTVLTTEGSHRFPGWRA